jgi:hypothetical protein
MSTWESEMTPEDWDSLSVINLGGVCQSCSQFWETTYRNAGAKSVNYTLVEPLECSECEGEE